MLKLRPSGRRRAGERRERAGGRGGGRVARGRRRGRSCSRCSWRARDAPASVSPKRQLLRLLTSASFHWLWSPEFHWLWSPDVISDYERGAAAVEANGRLAHEGRLRPPGLRALPRGAEVEPGREALGDDAAQGAQADRAGSARRGAGLSRPKSPLILSFFGQSLTRFSIVIRRGLRGEVVRMSHGTSGWLAGAAVVVLLSVYGMVRLGPQFDALGQAWSSTSR